MKDYPSQVLEVKEPIEQKDWEFIKSILKLVAEGIDHVKKEPSLAYLIFKDYRLKEGQEKPNYANIFQVCPELSNQY